MRVVPIRYRGKEYVSGTVQMSRLAVMKDVPI